MKNYISIFCLCISMLNAAAQSGIIIDHTCTDVAQIPDEYIERVKERLVNYVGESHARGVLYGFQLLAEEDSRYAVEVVFSGQNPIPTNKLVISRTYWDGNSWDEICGEQRFWTNQSGKDMLKAYLDYMKDSQGNPVAAFGFGWCWDMTWHNGPGGEIDPEHGVRWAGATQEGPSGDMRWGIDYEDSLSTGNSLCLQDYLMAVEEYNSHMPQTNTFFTTGPVDGYHGESGYQRFLKHEAIRAYVADNGGYLFDYADILNWDGDDQYTISWEEQSYPVGDPDLATGGKGYDGGYGGSHISEAACLKLAKAMWWMLARMEGWQSSEQPSHVRIEEELSYRIYPNPGNGAISIDSDKSLQIKVYSTAGQLLIAPSTNSFNYSIDLTEFGTGTYICQLISESSTETTRIVVY